MAIHLSSHTLFSIYGTNISTLTLTIFLLIYRNCSKRPAPNSRIVGQLRKLMFISTGRNFTPNIEERK